MVYQIFFIFKKLMDFGLKARKNSNDSNNNNERKYNVKVLEISMGPFVFVYLIQITYINLTYI